MAHPKQVKLEIQLISHLANETDVDSANIRPDRLPQDPTYPAITYSTITSNTQHDIDIDYPVYQITAWHPQRSTCIKIADQIERALNRYKGIMGDVHIKWISPNPGPGILLDKEAGHDGVYYIPQDFKIIFARQKG